MKSGRTRKALHVYRGTFCAEKFVTNRICLAFGQGGKSLRFLCETILKDLSKQQSMFREKHFETKRFFSEKKSWLFLLNLNEEIPDVGKRLRQGCGNRNLSDCKNILKKTSFGWRCNFKFFHRFSGETLIRKKTPVSSGRHSRCPGELSELHFSRRTKGFQTFGLWARMFRVSGETKTSEMSKLHAICWEKHFERKGFFLKKKHNFETVCWFRMSKSQFLAKRFDKGLEIEIHVTSRTFWKRFLW